MRRVREVRKEILSRPDRWRKVAENLKVKEVCHQGKRYIVCLNPDEAEKDACDRKLILEVLREKLGEGPKALVGNRSFRRYLRVERGAVKIDPRKVEAEARYDGKWVLRTKPNFRQRRRP